MKSLIDLIYNPATAEEPMTLAEIEAWVQEGETMTPEQIARWLYNHLNFVNMPERTYDIPSQLLTKYLALVKLLDIDENDIKQIALKKWEPES